MKHNFLNWEKAVIFKQQNNDEAVKGALLLLHQGIQECAGLPLDSLAKKRLPVCPLDMLWFYDAISKIICNWNIDFTLSTDENIDLEVAMDDMLSLSKDSRESLLKFAICLAQSPRNMKVDESFCCWLFAETILKKDLLTGVLDGSVERLNRNDSKLDFDDWAKLWI
jgi:hypothetical protein